MTVAAVAAQPSDWRAAVADADACLIVDPRALAALPAPEGSWSAVCFDGCLPQLGMLGLLALADRLLHDGPSTLWVRDRFVPAHGPGSTGTPASLTAFDALAARMGWRRTGESAAAMPSAGPLPAAPALLQWSRERAPSARLVGLGEGDSASVRALFERVFGHALSAEEWRWKYAAGGGQAVGLMQDGELLAHYGGMPREVLFQGRPAIACQVCDVMVDPRARRTLARRGPLYQITASFLETQIGWGLPHRIGFGFPTDRHFVAADRLQLYAAVDAMVCASWPAQAAQGRAPHATRLAAEDLADGTRAGGMLDRLWQAMAAALPGATLGVRDRRWLRHRYVDHPRFRYECWLLQRRWTRRPIGLVVLRRHDTHLEWVDAVAPPSQWQTLLGFARAHAAALGLPRVDAWITESHQPLLQALAPADCSLAPLGIDVPANMHTPGPPVDAQRGRWLLMAGDTDFR